MPTGGPPEACVLNQFGALQEESDRLVPLVQRLNAARYQGEENLLKSGKAPPRLLLLWAPASCYRVQVH